ncbi:MAG: hypothetical protein EYC70_09320 [Planctomycetota bacterium]|nr:MAG: hypothetical protein EYC70_09320 [Planctomycetota bacterium]
MFRSTSILVLLGAIGVSCSSTLTELSSTAREVLTSSTFKATYKDVFLATVHALQDEGYLVRVSDTETGTIEAEYDESGGFDGDFDTDLRRKVAASVRTRPAGTLVRFTLLVEERDDGTWFRTDPDAGLVEEVCARLFFRVDSELNAGGANS